MKSSSKAYPCKDYYTQVLEATVGGEWWAEFQFCDRKWRFDYACRSSKLAIEIDGAIFRGGRHSGGIGQLKDFEKMNAAAELGWRVLHYIPQQKFLKLTLDQIERCKNNFAK